MRGSVLTFVLLAGCATGGGEIDTVRTDGGRDATTSESGDPPDDASTLFETEGDGPGDTGSACGDKTPCKDACVSTADDPNNCGSCGVACPEVKNAVRTCVASSCGFTCNEGFAKCGSDVGCDTNVASDPANCGGCGKACPSGATLESTCSGKTCSTSCKSGYVSLSGHCTNFGGAYESNGAGCASCNNGNPYASGACGCAAGTTPSPPYALKNDCSGVRVASLTFCESSGAAAGTWGGAYQIDDAVPCGAGCRVSNPKSSGCTCPTGYTGVNLRAVITNACGATIGSRIVVCVHPSAPLDNFGGVYQNDDAVTGGVGCRASNPRTGGCSCPTGFTASPLRVIVDSSAGFIGSQAFVCTR